jgi:hypothetical protein
MPKWSHRNEVRRQDGLSQILGYFEVWLKTFESVDTGTCIWYRPQCVLLHQKACKKRVRNIVCKKHIEACEKRIVACKKCIEACEKRNVGCKKHIIASKKHIVTCEKRIVAWKKCSIACKECKKTWRRCSSTYWGL